MTDASVPPPPDVPPPDVPPPSMPPAQPQYGSALAGTGPLGKPRNIGVTILLAIVTLGIYCFFWVYNTYEELKSHTGQGIGGLVGLLIQFFISPVNFFIVPSEIKNLYERDGRVSPVTPLWGLWFLLPIIGPFVWYFKVQGSLNDYWVSKGASPA